MKAIFRILSCVLVLSAFSSTYASTNFDNTVAETSIHKQRFEIIQSGEHFSFALMLDKYTGNTWIFSSDEKSSGWDEVYRQESKNGKPFLFRVHDKEADYNRFQIKVVDDEVNVCYLIDTETGISYYLTFHDGAYIFIQNTQEQ